MVHTFHFDLLKIKGTLHLVQGSKTRSEKELGLEAGADAGEGAVHLATQEGQDQDNNDSNEYEDQGVFNKALAFLLQLFDLSAHCYLR